MGIWMVLAAAALLAWLLFAMHRYERESAAATREEVAKLRERVEALTLRVQNLEAIAAVEDDALLPKEEPPSTKEEHSVSSGRRPPLPS